MGPADGLQNERNSSFFSVLLHETARLARYE